RTARDSEPQSRLNPHVEHAGRVPHNPMTLEAACRHAESMRRHSKNFPSNKEPRFVRSDSYLVEPVAGPLNGTVRPPGSKSLTNRALVVAALARGESRLTNVLDSQDTQVMFESWRRLGVAVEHDPVENTVRLLG